MTRMIPETIHSSVKSAAEKRMFEVIRDVPGTERWVCFHSLGLAEHDNKRRAEIDFALITHHGIFVLEVKGGRIKRRNGVWYSVNKHDELHKLRESPFEQASQAMFALQKRIRAHFKNTPQADALFGYGVLTPDITFDLHSPESSRELVYDRRDTEKPFTTYINRLAAFARAAEARDKRPALKPDAIEALADFLRGDFDFIPSPELVIDDVRKQLNDLTKEQRIVLDVLQDSERVIIDGGAGTGKTLLAIEAAQRMAHEGKRVLFLCYNKLLAARIEARIGSRHYEGELLVRNLHRHFFDVIEGTSFAEELQEKLDRKDDDAFKQQLPEYAALVASDSDEASFDALVIDEAQDILTTPNLDALNEILRGGLEQGRWCVFLDAQAQASVYDNLDQAAFERLQEHGVRERLTLNCRNTRPIARQTALISNTAHRIKARIDGKPVEFKVYRRQTGWASPLERVIADLRREDVPPGRISVLLTNKPTEKEQHDLERLGLVHLTEDHVPALGTSALEHITWSVVSGFKGLENDVVVLVGVKDIESDWHQGVTYVGMSRARTRLHVIIREDCDEKRQQRMKEEQEKQNSDVEMLL
jgi:hypothetical protein